MGDLLDRLAAKPKTVGSGDMLDRMAQQSAATAPPNAGLAGVAPPSDMKDMRVVGTIAPKLYDKDFNPVNTSTMQSEQHPSLTQRVFKGTAGNAQKGLEHLGIEEGPLTQHDENNQVSPQVVKGVNDFARAGVNWSVPAIVAGGVSAPLETALTVGAAVHGSKLGRGITSLFTPNPDVQELGGNIGGAALGGAAGKMMFSSPEPLTHNEAVNSVTNAFNPPPSERPGFISGLQRQLPKIIDSARTNGQNVDSLDSFAQAAETARNLHPGRAKYIDPFVNEQVSTNQIPGYQGGRVGGESPNATLGQLDQRLTEINADLYPKYERSPEGSRAQAAALNGPQQTALKAEAAAIRRTIANTVAAKMGVPASEVAAARGDYGQLADVADTARYYADQATAAANKIKNGPVSISPFGHKTFVLDYAANKIRGNPADKAVANVFGNYEPLRPYGPPEAPVTAPVSNRPAPLWRSGSALNVVSSGVPEPVASATTPPESVEGPVVRNGRIVTVREQRAAAEAAAARARANAATATPPNAAGATDVVGKTDLSGNPQTPGGGVVVRPPLALPGIPERPALPENIDRATPLPEHNPDLSGFAFEVPRNVQEGAVPNLVRNAIDNRGLTKVKTVSGGAPDATELLSGHNSITGGSLEELGRGGTLRVNTRTGGTTAAGGNIDVGDGEAVLRQRPDGTLEVVNNNSGVGDREVLQRFGRNAAETFGKPGRAPGTVEVIHNATGQHGDVPLSRASDYLGSGDYRLAPRRTK